MNRQEISFIIPALNEEAHIGGVLDSIRKNVQGHLNYEVLVVDNGSRDRTVDIALEKGATCLHAPGCTISFLRNLGASEARYEILVFLDADVYLTKEWGERIVEGMEKLHDYPHIITGSFCGISDENNWIERVWFAPRTQRSEEINYMNSGHLVVHRSLFMRVGGFDPEMETGEDYEFCYRARMLGAQIENDPGLKVVHAGYPKSIKHFFCRERWHARGDYKSLSALASSKPALVSLANLCMAVISIAGMILCSYPWFTFPCAYLLFIAGVSVAATLHRCRGKLDSRVWGVIFLYVVYFTARTVSLIDVAIKR